MKQIIDLLNRYPLASDERYHLYVLRPDGWPFGLFGSYDDAGTVASTYADLARRRENRGLWITKESNDGTVDQTIIKKIRAAY